MDSYTVAWKRSKGDIALDNAVEYKSLPSGLHAVQSDLVYFTHEEFAGLSAFAKGDAGVEERNAHFVSVGVLVKKESAFDRLGRAWLLAGRLEKLAAVQANDYGEDSDNNNDEEDARRFAPLEEFWQQQGASSHHTATTSSSQTHHSRPRALSTVSAAGQVDGRLPAFHPARSLLHYIDTFGPLVFRLLQAALLRKRVLFVGSPPVRAACEFGI